MTTRISGTLAEEHVIDIALQDGASYVSKLSNPLYMIIIPSTNLAGGTAENGTAISYGLNGKTFTFNSVNGTVITGNILIRGRL